MQRDREFLLDILEAAKLVVSYVGEKSKENFLKDIQCQDAVVRRFEIIGEASRRNSLLIKGVTTTCHLFLMGNYPLILRKSLIIFPAGLFL